MTHIVQCRYCRRSTCVFYLSLLPLSVSAVGQAVTSTSGHAGRINQANINQKKNKYNIYNIITQNPLWCRFPFPYQFCVSCGDGLTTCTVSTKPCFLLCQETLLKMDLDGEWRCETVGQLTGLHLDWSQPPHRQPITLQCPDSLRTSSLWRNDSVVNMWAEGRSPSAITAVGSPSTLVALQ